MERWSLEQIDYEREEFEERDRPQSGNDALPTPQGLAAALLMTTRWARHEEKGLLGHRLGGQTCPLDAHVISLDEVRTSLPVRSDVGGTVILALLAREVDRYGVVNLGEFYERHRGDGTRYEARRDRSDVGDAAVSGALTDSVLRSKLLPARPLGSVGTPAAAFVDATRGAHVVTVENDEVVLMRLVPPIGSPFRVSLAGSEQPRVHEAGAAKGGAQGSAACPQWDGGREAARGRGGAAPPRHRELLLWRRVLHISCT